MRLTTTTVLALALSTPALAKDVATVDGKPFTEDQFKQALDQLGPQAEMVKANPQVRTQFLDHLINSQLLAKAGKDQKLDQSKRYKDQMDAASREILARIYLEDQVNKEAGDEKQLKAYFEKNKAKFSDKEVRASHILFKEEQKAEAEKVLAEAKKKGADFAALAKKHSQDPAGKNGGDLNFFGRGRMVPEFETVAFKMKKGDVHPELVKSQFGYHIIKLTDERGSDNVKFEGKKDQIAQEYKRESRETLVKNLRDKAKVKVDEEALSQLKL